MHYVEQDLSRFTLIAANPKYDFYYSTHKLGAWWYTIACQRGTNRQVTIGGFTTRKTAKWCAAIWSTWMGV